MSDTTARSSVFTLEVPDPQTATKLAGLLPSVIDHGRVKVSFRARGDQEATRIATEALAAAGEVRPAELTTGLGIHKRVVAVQDDPDEEKEEGLPSDYFKHY